MPKPTVTFDVGLPHDTQAEAAYLGGLLQGAQLGADELAAGDFYDSRHRLIYRTAAALAESGEAVNRIAVGGALQAQGQLEAAGGWATLAALDDPAQAFGSRAGYAASISEKARRRRIIEGAVRLAEAAATGTAGELEESAALLHEAASGRSEQQPEALTADELEGRFRAYANSINESRVPTGIPPLDATIGGLARGQVLTILARTGVGKSAIAQNMIGHFLARGGETSVVFVSAEMPPDEVFARAMQIHAGKTDGAVVGAYRCDTTALLNRDAFMDRARGRLLVIPRPHLTLSAVERMIRAQVRLGRIREAQLVALDYLGLFDAGRRNASDVERYGQIARDAKVLAKRLNVALVLICQASRTARDGGQEVTITDARMSGEIEEACDFLVGVWRPALSAEVRGNEGEYRRWRNVMKWRLLKARRCRLDEFETTFDGPTLRVEPMGAQA